MPLFSREKSSLKGRWRLETVQGMRSSGSNPVSCSETSIKIYGSKEEIRARKSPETVDAPGFAPDASIPVILYGRSVIIGFHEITNNKNGVRVIGNQYFSIELSRISVSSQPNDLPKREVARLVVHYLPSRTHEPEDFVCLSCIRKRFAYIQSAHRVLKCFPQR